MMTERSANNPAQRQKLESLKQEIWWRDLSLIDRTLGQLVFLTSLRDSTGAYRDARLARKGTPAEIDLALREAHEDVWGTWLSFSLEKQRQELLQHVRLIREKEGLEAEIWLKVDPYLRLIPDRAGAAERELYHSDLEILLELLKEDLF